MLEVEAETVADRLRSVVGLVVSGNLPFPYPGGSTEALRGRVAPGGRETMGERDMAVGGLAVAEDGTTAEDGAMTTESPGRKDDGVGTDETEAMFLSFACGTEWSLRVG